MGVLGWKWVLAADVVSPLAHYERGTPDLSVTHSPSTVNEIPKCISESDDSISEFEMNLRKLMPSLLGEPGESNTKESKGTRCSERMKKPYSRFNEEASFLAEPPKSTKKKIPQGESSEGTTSKLLLISDWTNAQLASYCDACGISFTDASNDCFNHIGLMEQTRVASLCVSASSLEDRVA